MTYGHTIAYPPRLKYINDGRSIWLENKRIDFFRTMLYFTSLLILAGLRRWGSLPCRRYFFPFNWEQLMAWRTIPRDMTNDIYLHAQPAERTSLHNK